MLFDTFGRDSFADRTEAGRRLAEALQRFEDQQPVVLALPRGGVPVAAEIAAVIEAPLDVLIVRRLGVPRQEELAFGAIAPGGVNIFNEPLMTRLRLTGKMLDERLGSWKSNPLPSLSLPELPVLKNRTVTFVDKPNNTQSQVWVAGRVMTAKDPDAVVLRTIGRQYAGEPLARWSYGLYARRDGEPVWLGPPDRLLDDAAEHPSAEPQAPELEPLRRVTIGSLLTIAVLLAAAYFVFTAIANVGIDQVVDELEKAESAWLWAALAIVPVVPVAQAFGTMGASTLPLRLGPVIGLEYAVQFIALAVPSSAARVAMNVRFFQKQGAPAAQALTIGLIDSVFGFIVQVLILVTILV